MSCVGRIKKHFNTYSLAVYQEEKFVTHGQNLLQHIIIYIKKTLLTI